MSTYRERREAKAEKLREWAEKRQAAASNVLNQDKEIKSDWAFITQPGHIPYRARIIAREDRAHQSLNKAHSMESRATGIEHQLADSIYSDDPDAVEALEAKIAQLEAKREAIKQANAAYRKAHRAELAEITRTKGKYWAEETMPHQAYEGANISGNISRLRKRLDDVKARQARAAKADESGGVAIQRRPLQTGDSWVTVTFAEKPDREVLDALRAAGYRWGSGSWAGYGSKLPEAVAALEAVAAAQ